jgi:hypothetical protein
MTWEFVTKPVRGVNAVSWLWEWRCVGEVGTRQVSGRTFPSFRECVSDAQVHGFTGDADPRESGTLFQRPESRFKWV